jgi:hypothetical protein
MVDGEVIGEVHCTEARRGRRARKYSNPEAHLQSFAKREWVIAIGPRVLAPADKADSTADLWVISLVYVAAPGKEFPDIASLHRSGVKIGTIHGAPSDPVLAEGSLCCGAGYTRDGRR